MRYCSSTALELISTDRPPLHSSDPHAVEIVKRPRSYNLDKIIIQDIIWYSETGIFGVVT